MVDHYSFFLRETATLDALDALSSANDLVLYCGAGVSIDRTGLSWSQLIHAVYEQAASTGRSHRERQLKTIDYLLAHLSSAEQQASILTEYFTERKPETANILLTRLLQQVLYEDNGWSEGALLENIARLAIIASVRLKTVTILTTNYDVYLEEAFQAAVENMRDLNADEIPGLERLVSPALPSEEEWKPERMLDPVGTDAVVRIVYLHGRVARAGEPTEGTIVLDEFSYARTHSAVTNQLRTYLADAAVLTVGASVTDAPLIQALALTKTPETIKRRFSLVPSAVRIGPQTDGTKYVDTSGAPKFLAQSDVDELIAYRGSQLGIHILHPRSHAQTAQFVRELDLAITLHRSPSGARYRDPNAGVNYAERLKAWSVEWASRAPTSAQAYEVLRRALHDDVSVILGGSDAQNRALRMEVWVRINPSSGNRTLTLFANSTGPLNNFDVLRRDELAADAPNASIRTFLQGRPLLLTLEDLGLQTSSASRWKTFFCVPLSVLIKKEVNGVPYTASIPAGVITLAGLAHADLADRFHNLSLDDIKRLKTTMTAAGLDILRP